MKPLVTTPRLALLAAPLALFFAPSTTLAQTAGDLGPEQARVAWVRGAVEVVGADAHAARAGEVLSRGERIRTGAGASAAVALPNGSLVELDPGSLLVMFASPSPAGAAPSSVTTLARGAVRIHAAPSGARATPVPVATQAVTVWAGRADAMVAADLGGHITRMAVWRGRMRVRMGSREYLLTQGYGVQEEVGHRPGVLQQLPRAPVWRATPPTRVLSFGEPIDVSGAWGPNPHARAAAPANEWKVEVARDESFRDLVERVSVPLNTPRWTGRALAPGTYHVRVVAVDVNRFESTASPVARVQIAAPTVLPATEGPDERRAMVRIPQGFYCGLDGAPLASWEAPLPLAPGRPHTLRCATDPAGRNARERLIPAGLSGPLRREVQIAPPASDTAEGPAVGSLSLRLRDAEDVPVSLARIEATASDGVTVDAVRETDQRGVYTATLHWPRGVRACRVRFTINEALHFEQDARAERVQVVTPQAAPPRHDPARVHVDTLHIAPPHDPDDDAPFDREE